MSQFTEAIALEIPLLRAYNVDVVAVSHSLDNDLSVLVNRSLYLVI